VSARYKLFLGLSGAALATLALDYLTSHGHHGGGHAAYWWHSMIGFELLYGLLGAAVLSVFAKLLVFPVIKRSEDYYPEGEE